MGQTWDLISPLFPSVNGPRSGERRGPAATSLTCVAGIGQGINRTTGRGIGSTGGWIEAGSEITPWYSLFGGYTIDSPDEADVPTGGRIENSAWFIANRFSARPFVIGIDYLRWPTRYRGLPDRTDNRLNTYVTSLF